MSSYPRTFSMRTYALRSREQKVDIPADIYPDIAALYRKFTGIKESTSSADAKQNTGLAVAALEALGFDNKRVLELLGATELYTQNSDVQDYIFLDIARVFCKGYPEKVEELDQIQKTLHLPGDLSSRLS